MPRLIRLSTNEVLEFYDEFTIGRSLDCSHVIEEVTISRKHCKVFLQDNKWFISDTSSNGLFLNAIKLRPMANVVLKNNDIIKINVNYEFCFKESATDSAPANNYDDAEVIVIDDSLTEESNNATVKINATASSTAPPVPAASTSSSAAHNIDFSEELTCSICMELFISAVTVNCHHTFCESCINKWRSANKKCPICRKNITTQLASITIDNMVQFALQQMNADVQEARNRTVSERKSQLEKEKQQQQELTTRALRGRARGARGARARGTYRGRGRNRVYFPPEVIDLETADTDSDDDLELEELLMGIPDDNDLIRRIIVYSHRR